MLKSIENILGRVMRYNDVMLAVLIIMVIGIIVLPIEPWALDSLLCVNLTLSVVMLMMAIYMPNVLAFSTFPSVLLFTTLFRLSLNIAATRLILTKAYAGEVILTFGNFVVSGNFIVGAVIFIIILIVQFIVITKGSERVAEVAARFTLDAMPGKQMSIDADMRAGTLDVDQARKMRSDLEKENKLYGAMDGAMKFVKGDAIAGLIIVSVNLVAGFAIGVLQKGFTIEKAIKTYSILTIGDGLVTQIPALLISITAGVIVTRVGSDDGIALGGDIGRQLLSQPKALMIGGGIIAAFALIPGFPKLQFLFLAGLVGMVGYTLSQLLKKEGRDEEGGIPALAGAGKDAEKEGKMKKAGEEFSITMALMLDVSSSVKEFIKPEELNDELIRIRKALYVDLGVPFPGIHLRFNDKLPVGEYQILLQEVPVTKGVLRKNQVLVRETESNLNIMGIPFEQGRNFLPNIPSLWINESYQKQLIRAGIGTLGVSQILTYHISFILKRYAGEFLGIQETRYLLEHMEKEYGELVREVQRILPLQKIAEVLQRLVQEEVSVRNLKLILQALIEWGQKEKETVLLTEYCRSSLKRYISYKYTSGQNMLPVYLLNQDIEDMIRKAIRQTSSGNYLALEPDIAKQILQAVKEEVGDLTKNQQSPVMLTAMDLRRYVRKLIEMDLFDLPVLSHQELTDEITVQPLGRVGI